MKKAQTQAGIQIQSYLFNLSIRTCFPRPSILLLCLVLFFFGKQPVLGQKKTVDLPRLVQLLNQKQPALVRQHPILNPRRLEALYNQTGDEYLWSAEWEPFRKAFIQTLERVGDLGLDRNNYHYSLLKTLTARNPLALEVYTSDALLTFMEHVGYGTNRPVWLTINPDCDPVGQEFGVETYLLTSFANCYTFPQVLEGTEPQTRVYQAVKAELIRVNSLIDKTELTTGLVPYSEKLSTNSLLINRLKAWGTLSVKPASPTEDQLRQAVMAFQQKVSEPADGKLTVSTLAKLNKPFAYYQKQLTQSLNSWRWLNAINEYKTLVLNLPAAELYAFEGSTIALSMRTLLGKPETPTPQFFAQLNKVTFSPNAGPSGFLPYHFPPAELMVFAQNLNLPASFQLENRYRNLGGIQIDNPVELAGWLLNDKEEANHLMQMPPIQTGSVPVSRRISPPVSLLVFSNTIGIDGHGNIRLYDNAYQPTSFSRQP